MDERMKLMVEQMFGAGSSSRIVHDFTIDGMHHFSVGGAHTGRFSSSGPNLTPRVEVEGEKGEKLIIQNRTVLVTQETESLKREIYMEIKPEMMADFVQSLGAMFGLVPGDPGDEENEAYRDELIKAGNTVTQMMEDCKNLQSIIAMLLRRLGGRVELDMQEFFALPDDIQIIAHSNPQNTKVTYELRETQIIVDDPIRSDGFVRADRKCRQCKRPVTGGGRYCFHCGIGRTK